MAIVSEGFIGYRLSVMVLKPTILLVEDNHDHLRIIKRILERSDLTGTILVARDGKEALAKLAASKGNNPDLILLDLNMPRLSGQEVLKAIKANPLFASVPVVIVSSSNRREDTTAATELGAAGFISKSEGFQHFTRALTSLKKFLPDISLTSGKI